MNDFDQKILDSINSNPGQKAREIASMLGVDRRTVKSALYGRLKQKVRQDKAYRWYPKNTTESIVEETINNAKTPLTHLCQYYLDCLSHDDLGGVSAFASSNYNNLDYAELDIHPMFTEEVYDPFDSDEGRRLLNRIRQDRNRKTIYLGYPVRLNFIRSRRGWEGFMVEPLLLFPFQEVENRYGTPILSDDMPQINFKALKSLTNMGEINLMDEGIQLAEELGLGNEADGQPDIDELVERLHDIRSEWDWQEAIDPYALSDSIPLSQIENQGIYNRVVLIATERSPYTKGLETELGMLQSVNEENYQDSALGAWVSSQIVESPSVEEKPLLEVLSLNSEQRQAVRQSLSNPMTVITGPPGTGKSQVVTSILINAAWQGKTVLFASKNNKAVDVVETRVNALDPRPVLLRLGANQYQNRLAQYLTSLLAASATKEDQEHYNECINIHNQLESRSDKIDKNIQDLIALRNKIDRIEQKVESLREEVGSDYFYFYTTSD